LREPNNSVAKHCPSTVNGNSARSELKNTPPKITNNKLISQFMPQKLRKHKNKK
jgi:hypothetical protein